jgi:flavin-dependent dehydrogenase
MVEQARLKGVRFLWNSTVSGLHPDGVIVDGNLVRARWVIGADGSGSRVRRWANLDVHRKEKQRFAFRRHYRVKPWTDFMELHWGKKCQLYVTPVSSEEICLALISRDPKLRLDEAIPQFPEVAKRVYQASHGSIERGAVSVTRKLVRVCNERIALVGDASGGVDAITGEGLCLAFKQANLLGESLSAGQLSAYGSAYQSLVRRPALMARLMLMLEHRAWLRVRVMKSFVSEPKLFAGMLAAHVGAAVAADLIINGLSLGWNLFTA